MTASRCSIGNLRLRLYTSRKCKVECSRRCVFVTADQFWETVCSLLHLQELLSVWR